MLAYGVALAADFVGGSGNDNMVGTAANDSLYGAGGHDTIQGLAGSDEIAGGSGNDRLFGTDTNRSARVGNDSIAGQEGNDTIMGGSGSDSLSGGLGADYIISGPQNDAAIDSVSGGDGNDTIDVANYPASKDDVSCGLGIDRVIADHLDVVASDCEAREIAREVGLIFTEDLAVSQALNTINALNANPKELISRHQVGDDEYTAGYIIDAGEPVSAAGVTNAMIAMFEDDGLLLDESQNTASTEQIDATTSATPDDTDPMPVMGTQEETNNLNSTIASLEADGARIDEVSVQTATSIAKLEQNTAIESAVEVPTTAQSQPGEEGSVQTNNVGSDARWAPKRGYISTRCCHVSGYRYVYQNFIWNDWRLRNLKRISSNVTYESDATYNREGGTYLGRVKSWSSNLPRAYRDTELLDSVTGDLRVMTVGTANAHRLRANKYYYTSIRATNGRKNSNAAGATAQNGYRYPPACYRAYCIFGRASDVLLYVGDYRAPGSRRYVSNS